ncbi:hypothetical protein TI05_00020 [Achromatium sp. WMS3]|nr:hypothetical protein TI05_00020 [Achromatium sp. WMS3]
MIPELGQFTLAIALALACIQTIFPLWGSFNNTPNWMLMAKPLAWGQFLFLTLSFACLLYAFWYDDFSVRYVATNSNSKLPNIYKISASWGAHEGSMLLWALLLSTWGAAVAIFSKQLTQITIARILAILGLVTTGFLFFIILTSNPFARLFPVPIEGRDLNPLLQDFGLAIHPPTLYMGYVGLSVSWSAAIAALLDGKLDAAWAHWSRPWTLIAWVFLTIGITLGSWWAYYELGWGGWWFWDPVENASLMPWLVSTALIHSLAVTEKRGAFKNWTVLLALAAFSLSLLGTFLVRSGVLTSVHAFASDPARGLFILIFLCLIIGGSLVLYALRSPGISIGGRFELLSRETLLLANNLILTLFTIIVLFGTLAPLIYDAMNAMRSFAILSLIYGDLGKISVGFPWFNTMFVYILPTLALLIGFGPAVSWKNGNLSKILQRLGIALATSIIIGMGIWCSEPIFVAVGLALALWIFGTHVIILWLRGYHPRYYNRQLLPNFMCMMSQSRSFFGMWLAHIGVACFIVGITIVSHYSTEQDLLMKPGDRYTLMEYQFEFQGVTNHLGPNYQARKGKFQVTKSKQHIVTLEPEKRTYQARSMPMTEAAIHPGLTRDLYVSLGEPIGTGGAWSVRIHYKPYVRWIWLGGLLMALGGLWSVSDRRYRLRTTASSISSHSG